MIPKESEKIIQDVYLSLLSKEPKHPSGTKVRCCKCGKSDTTLRKLPDGQYICNNGWLCKEIPVEVVAEIMTWKDVEDLGKFEIEKIRRKAQYERVAR